MEGWLKANCYVAVGLSLPLCINKELFTFFNNQIFIEPPGKEIKLKREKKGKIEV